MITLRPIETHAELAMAEDVQRQVWPGTDLEVVPLHVLSTAAHNGGVLIGAFDDDQLIGFVFGFLG
ncbi:MAG: hypothetical protein ACT4QE_13575, partial [Anaerolineales bacterium]